MKLKLNEIIGIAFFIALGALLSMFKIILIPKILEIDFSSLALAGCSLVFGPMLSGIAGIIADNVKFFLNPTGAYMPLFALNEYLTGVIYGLFFYKKEITIPKVILARLVIVLLINICLTPLWLHLLYGKAYFVYVQARILKNIVMFPIDVFLLYSILKGIKRVFLIKK